MNPQAKDLKSQIVLLTLSFPRLKVIWSSSPYQTAEIFEELKKQQDEPNPQVAVGIGLEEGEEEGSRTFNQTPGDLLRAVPGVTSKNVTPLMLEVESIHVLANMEEHEIEARVGRAAARQIYRFFNRSLFDDGPRWSREDE